MAQPLSKETHHRTFADTIEVRNEHVAVTIVKGKRYTIETKSLRHIGTVVKIDKKARTITLKEGFFDVSDPIKVDDIVLVTPERQKVLGIF